MTSNSKKLIGAAILLAAVTSISTWALLRQKPGAAQATVKQERYVLYTLPGCPHCEVVHEFIKTNNIAAKVKYTELDASDPKAAQELLARGTTCGLPKDQLGGVPLLWDNDTSKCFVGDIAINDQFALPANQIPQP